MYLKFNGTILCSLLFSCVYVRGVLLNISPFSSIFSIINSLDPRNLPPRSLSHLAGDIPRFSRELIATLFPFDPVDDTSEFPDSLQVTKIVSDAGYPLEIHHVITDDGYILELHRIPHGKGGNYSASRRPILLMHGFLCSSLSYLAAGEDRSLGYVLAKHGYDVWLINTRGNTFSGNHTLLSPTDKKFWKFGIDDSGLYDISACIDYVLQETKWNQVDYVGFSLGTIAFFVLTTTRPEYNDKVRKAALMAPTFYQDHSKGPFNRATSLWPSIRALYRALDRVAEFPPSSLLINSLYIRLCSSDHLIYESLCQNAFYTMEGSYLKGVSRESISKLVASFPNRSSLQTFRHFNQLYSKGPMRYDHGRRRNLKKYGQSTPPTYNISQVTTPVALFWSEDDNFESTRDIWHLSRELRHLDMIYEVPGPKFLHSNFMWDDQINEKLYDILLHYLLS